MHRRDKIKLSLPKNATEDQFEYFFYIEFRHLLHSPLRMIDALNAFDPFRNRNQHDLNAAIDVARFAGKLFLANGELNTNYLHENNIDFSTNAPRMSLKVLKEYGFLCNGKWNTRDIILLVAIYNIIQSKATDAFHQNSKAFDQNENMMRKGIKSPKNHLEACVSRLPLQNLSTLFKSNFQGGDEFLVALDEAFKAQAFKYFCESFIEHLPGYAQEIVNAATAEDMSIGLAEKAKKSVADMHATAIKIANESIDVNTRSGARKVAVVVEKTEYAVDKINEAENAQYFAWEKKVDNRLEDGSEKSEAILKFVNDYRLIQDQLTRDDITLEDAIGKIYHQVSTMQKLSNAQQNKKWTLFKSRVGVAADDFCRKCEEIYPDVCGKALGAICGNR